MGYEGNILLGTVYPEYARAPPLDCMRTITKPIFKTNKLAHITHSSSPINIGFSAKKTEDKCLKYEKPLVEADCTK